MATGITRTTAATSTGRVVALPLPGWKRAIDLIVAGTAALILAPIALVVAAAIVVTMGRPVLFRQARGGLGGTEFDIVKFRTMTNRLDEHGNLLPDEARRHWLGNLLRKSSLDELPTLLNILKGEMSLVGPRPLMAVYLDRYSPREAQRHCVTPGLTGLAQTRGRNTLTWDDKFTLDLEYVHSRSLATDLRILRDTVSIVVSGTGADGNDHTTEFTGSSA